MRDSPGQVIDVSPCSQNSLSLEGDSSEHQAQAGRDIYSNPVRIRGPYLRTGYLDPIAPADTDALLAGEID